jgi:hypothetical protein
VVLFVRCANAYCRMFERYENGDRRAGTGTLSATCDGDLTSSPLNKLLSYPETDTASQVALCGEERFEDVFQMLLFYPCPTVPDHDLNTISRGAKVISRSNVKQSSPGHRIRCVCDDVGENLD